MASMIVLFPLKVLLIAIDLLITFVTFGWVKALKRALTPASLRSIEVSGPHHRIGNGVKARLPKGSKTLYSYATESIEKFGDKNLLGTRRFLGMHSPKVKHFGDVTWTTYTEAGVIAHKFGAALRGAGLVAAPSTTTLEKTTTPCSLAVFENTCEEWLLATIGAFSQSMVITTIYATLGMDAVVLAVNDGMIPAVLCNQANVEALASRVADMPTLKTIVYTKYEVAPGTQFDPPSVPGVTVISFNDFVAGGDTAKYPPTPPTEDTTAVVMYTSGSTGKPKGVVISHSSVATCAGAAAPAFELEEGKDVYLGYLPMAHIMELMAEFSMLSNGITICYADPKTLTAKGSYPHGALEEFKPTVMAGVPKIWDIIKKGIEAKISTSPPIAQFLVKTAFQARKFAMARGYDTPLFKALVFKKFSAVVGGRLRVMLSGGGPLNVEVQEFIRTCFGAPIIQGYGLTETVAGLSVQALDDFSPGVVGPPIPTLEVKLVSTPEINDKAGFPYLITDTKDTQGDSVFGRGEITCKGPNVSSGYYMMPEKTKEEWNDGWFSTGDIGQFMSDGSIKIVDRKKNLVKMKGGEYVALENMEMCYGNSNFVDAVNGGICCYGDGDMDRPIALMQLEEAAAVKWGKANGLGSDLEAVKKSPEFQAAVLKDMHGEAKKGGLSHLEKIVAVGFMPGPWTPENGCLTAANKLQRRKVIDLFEKEFTETKIKGVF